MENELKNTTSSNLETICKIIMVIIGIVSFLFFVLLHIEYCYETHSLKKYIGLYGEYGFPELIGTFLVTLTAQIYLEQLKISKISFIVMEKNQNRKIWDDKMNSWLASNRNLSDVMRNSLASFLPELYNILYENGMKIDNEATLNQILNRFKRIDLYLFENHDTDYIENHSTYYNLIPGYTFNYFWGFLLHSSNFVYSGANQRCIDWYNELLPKQPYDIPEMNTRFWMLYSEDM